MKTNYEKAVQIYEDGGVNAIMDAIIDGFLVCDGYHYCEPCELLMPHEGDTCLVCGTNNPQRTQNQALDHKIYFDRADTLWEWLEENELTDPVTLTIHLGAK